MTQEKNQVNDPGIGTKVDPRGGRIINADGSFNVVRRGAPTPLRDMFKYLVEISWFKFFVILFSAYVILNIFFTCIYLLVGFENIAGIDPAEGPVFFQAFFFSIQTFTTVGYGTLAPLGIASQSVAAFEAFVGFLSFSLATGLLYGRFSRPNAKVLFAKNFVYSKFEEGYSFKFKLVNERDTVLQDVQAKVITLFNGPGEDGTIKRSYYRLPITLPQIEFMALSWTLVHKIDEDSPFWNKSKEELLQMKPEILVTITGFDEVYGQRIRANKSYVIEEVVWNKNFDTIFKANQDGQMEIDINDINHMIDE